jgi:hypothetical protein
MCVQKSKWQIDQPGKNPVWVCNDHLGHMVERLAAAAGQNFQFGLQYVKGMVEKVCSFTEAGVSVEVESKSTTVEPIRVDAGRPMIGATATAEIVH